MGIDEKEILGSYSAAVDIQEEAAALVLQKKLPVMEIVPTLGFCSHVTRSSRGAVVCTVGSVGTGRFAESGFVGS